jgi:hypothetical protein
VKKLVSGTDYINHLLSLFLCDLTETLKQVFVEILAMNICGFVIPLWVT